MNERYLTKSSLETEAVGEALAKKLSDSGIVQAFIALEGDVGVGKTVFTRGFARFFGVSGIKSPTYTIVNEHRGKSNLYHFDLYRITDEDDLYSIGFDEYIDRVGYSIVEWSERLEGNLPKGAIRVRLTKTADGADERIIEITDLEF